MSILKKNLKFAETIEPSNAAITKKLEWTRQQRAANKPTVPSTVAEELTYNPFMRVKEHDMAKALKMEGKSPIDIMAELRKLKDNF